VYKSRRPWHAAGRCGMIEANPNRFANRFDRR
jgi:hypothetical protein